VRNREDGTVEAVFEGPAEAVEAMIEWCRSGPSRAEVEDMDVSLEGQPDGLEGFEVR
jgi:acylphosphatase